MVTFFTVHLLTTDDARYKLGIGAGVGLGMMTKYTITFWVAGLIVAILITSLAAWTEIMLRLYPEVPLWFIIVIWLNASIFEEAIKVLLVILLGSRAFLRDASQALCAGLAPGMSFPYLSEKSANC